MPSKLSIYPSNYDAKKNPARVDYQFENRKARLKNEKFTIQDLQFWKSQFYEPKTPRNWKKVVMDLEAQKPIYDQQPAPPPQARWPSAGSPQRRSRRRGPPPPA